MITPLFFDCGFDSGVAQQIISLLMYFMRVFKKVSLLVCFLDLLTPSNIHSEKVSKLVENIGQQHPLNYPIDFSYQEPYLDPNYLFLLNI